MVLGLKAILQGSQAYGKEMSREVDKGILEDVQLLPVARQRRQLSRKAASPAITEVVGSNTLLPEQDSRTGIKPIF